MERELIIKRKNRKEWLSLLRQCFIEPLGKDNNCYLNYNLFYFLIGENTTLEVPSEFNYMKLILISRRLVKYFNLSKITEE